MNIVVATTSDDFWQPQAMAMAEAMRRQGWEAGVVTPRSLARSLAGGGRLACDVLFCLGTGESVQPILDSVSARVKFLYLMESLPTPTESDEFTRSKWEVHRETLGAFDQVFVHTRRSIAWLRSAGVRCAEELIWPHFPTIFQPEWGASFLPRVDARQDIDVLFLGTHSPHRTRILEKVAGRFRLMADRRVFYEESAELYRRAKIVLNIHFTPLRNFECRVAEVLGSGGFLLTEPLEPGDVLLDGRQLAVFREDDVLERIAYYLERPELRATIAREGYAEIQKYSVDRQMQRVLAVAGELMEASGGGQPKVTVAGEQTRERGDALPEMEVTFTETTTTRFVFNDQPLALVHPRGESIEYMLREVFVKNVYPILRLFDGQAPLIFDVGANIGCASLWFRLAYPESTIFAFDPNPAVFRCLETNLGGTPRVRLFPFGFYARECTAALYQGKENSTTNSLSRSSHNQSAQTPVQLKRLSSFLQQEGVQRISLLKVDAEGVEIAILQDILGFLDRIDAIQLEYHSERDRREIDQILAERFVLMAAQAEVVHRGTVTYVAKEHVAASGFQDLEIPRPGI